MHYVPKGIPMHEKLSTSFVRVEALFDELKLQGFTGHVDLVFPQTTGQVYFSNGQILNAVETTGSERHSGKQVTDQLIRLSLQTRGQVSIYNLQKEAILALAGIADGEIVYHNLTSDFASLGKLVRKMAREQQLCFISLSFADQPSQGGLVYIEGEKIEAFSSTSQGLSTGAQALQQLESQSDTRLAAFSLYRAKGREVPSFDERDVERSFHTLTPSAPAAQPAVAAPAAQTASPLTTTLPLPPMPVPAFTAPPPVPVASAVAAPAATAPTLPTIAESNPAEVPAVQARAAETPRQTEENVLEVGETRSFNNGGAAIPPPPTPPPFVSTPSATAAKADSSARQATQGASTITLPESKPTADMSELTGLMSNVIAAVERGMTVAGRGSSFPTALRAGLLAVTEQYPFLDPFAAEFEYHDREIVFVGSATPDEFAKGLTEALRQMVEDLIYSSNGRVRDYIAEEISKVEKERDADLSRFSLDNITKKICQN
jgi:hypothetical protein